MKIKFHFRQSIWALIATSLFALSTNAQRPKVKNLPEFDQKFIHFGFSLGLNTTGFIMEHQPGRIDTLAGINVVPQSGFNLGIVANLHITPNLDLRFIPALSFGQRNLEYTFRSAVNNETSLLVKPIESTYIDLPLNLKFRTDRYNNFALYWVLGGQYSIDLISQADVPNRSQILDDIIVKLSPNTISGQIGFGFDFFLEYFKFSPEIKMSYGINNVLIQDNTVFSTPIDRLRSRILLVSFTFEG